MPRSQFIQMMVDAEELWSGLMNKGETTQVQSKHDLIQSDDEEGEVMLDSSDYDEWSDEEDSEEEMGNKNGKEED